MGVVRPGNWPSIDGTVYYVGGFIAFRLLDYLLSLIYGIWVCVEVMFYWENVTTVGHGYLTVGPVGGLQPIVATGVCVMAGGNMLNVGR